MSCRDLAITKKAPQKVLLSSALYFWTKKHTLFYTIQPLHCVGTHTSHRDSATTLHKVKHHQITTTFFFFFFHAMESQVRSGKRKKSKTSATLHARYPIVLNLSLIYISTERSSVLTETFQEFKRSEIGITSL